MAMTDIAEDDLDEMMREEAEDVFYEDGRLAKGQLWRERERAWVYRWAAGPRLLLEDYSAVRPAGFATCGCDQG
ncbi:rho family-interacting cell polarization regulator 2 isoform X1 [Lates japonicus]|uniref:Rho family-interacting cell polarization regulator 2 isoform X1 n=1 Tax=Lates japonicus TaxID=270547 RepID=A0AAD3MWQ3_LATJO|nr:rho family-interacting cell polarization regulator 2 isoform X1 [Lates japonicus]